MLSSGKAWTRKSGARSRDPACRSAGDTSREGHEGTRVSAKGLHRNPLPLRTLLLPPHTPIQPQSPQRDSISGKSEGTAQGACEHSTPGNAMRSG